MEYGWIAGFAEKDAFHSNVYESLPAPNMAWSGTARGMLHPRVVSLLKCKNISSAIAAIKFNCPLGWLQYFEHQVRNYVGGGNQTTQRDWVEGGRQYAFTNRHKVTPLLFYAWFFHAKHFAHTMRGKKRHRCGVKLRPNSERLGFQEE